MKPHIDRRAFLVGAACLQALAADAGESHPLNPSGTFPERGMVPDEATALAIARAVATAHFGPKALAGSPPVAVKLIADGQIWQINNVLPRDSFGGGIVVQISKSNGCISYINSTK